MKARMASEPRLDALAVSQRNVTSEFVSALKNNPTGEVQVLYKHEDVEAYLFASSITSALREAGWTVSGDPKSIPSSGGDPHFAQKDVPAAVRYDAQTGLSVWSGGTLNWDEGDTAGNALKNALLWGATHSDGMILEGDLSLPNGHFVIVVGQNFPLFQR